MPGVRSALLVGLVAALGLVGLGAACAWWLSHHDEELIYLGGGPARWIVAPVEPQTWAQSQLDLVTAFERSFEPSADTRTLTLRALGRATVTLNGRVVASPDDLHENWKRATTIAVAGALRPGANTLRVAVARSGGPAALNLTLGTLGTDEDWTVSIAGSSFRPARYAARHPRIDPGLPGTAAARPLPALAASLPVLGGFALLSILLVLAVGRLPSGWKPRLPAIATGLAVFGWLALYVHNAGQFPLTLGFDAQGHLDYIRYVLDERALPLANQGWQMYQPPLFYLLGAGVLETFSDAAFDARTLRAVTFGAGIAQVLLLGAVAGLLWPGRPVARALALGFGACLPMHLYLFHYVSNETLAMALNTAVSFLALRLLVREAAPSMKACLGLGACLGLALLAKFSAVVLLPLVVAALLVAFHRSGTERSTAAVRSVAMLAACGIACGWHFARVWVEFGNPLIGNWDPSLGFAWWQDPGFRTIADYTTFGRSLSAPWFGGFAGVLDGAYSTLWGDALASGATEVQYGAPWNHRLVAAGYVLSLLPLFAILVGTVAGLRRLLLGRFDPSRRAVAVYLLALAAVVVAALGYMTLKVPSYAQSKAFYIQPAMTALCVTFVFGSLRLLDLAGRFRAVWLVALATCGMTFYASVWVRPETPSVKVHQGYLALAGRDAGTAETRFREALGRDADHAGALAGLAAVHVAREQWTAAAEAANRALKNVSPERHPKLTARALNAVARADLATGRESDAERALRRAIALAPAERQSYRPLVRLLLEQGRPEEAAEVLRDQLWVNPHEEGLHRLLTNLANARRR